MRRKVSELISDLLGRSKTDNLTEDRTKSVMQISEGVVLHGPKEGRLENTNEFPVRIRRVWQFHGERTLSINSLRAGATLEIGYVSHQHGFYIYTMDGVLVGWLSGDQG